MGERPELKKRPSSRLFGFTKLKAGTHPRGLRLLTKASVTAHRITDGLEELLAFVPGVFEPLFFNYLALFQGFLLFGWRE
jgi:hypothetical protein